MSIAGFTIHTDSARALATAQFDGTLLYQVHLAGNVLASRDGYYISDVMTSMRKDHRQRHFFGSAEAERSRFAPNALTPEHSVNFMRGMFEIARVTEERLGLGVYPAIVADIGNYSYAFLRLHAKQRRVFAGYVRELAKLGLWKNPYFWGYSGALMVLPSKTLDRGIVLLKKMLPATPRLGKVYEGKEENESVGRAENPGGAAGPPPSRRTVPTPAPPPVSANKLHTPRPSSPPQRASRPRCRCSQAAARSPRGRRP